MKKILVAYLNETDLESTMSYANWPQLCEGFDITILFVRLSTMDSENINVDFPDHGFNQVIPINDTNLGPGLVLAQLHQILLPNQIYYLQIISHGNESGLALKCQDNGFGILNSLISYQELADCLISTNSTISLNCMTVCHSNSQALIEANFSFLVTTLNDIDTTVGLADSFRFNRQFIPNQTLQGTLDEKRTNFPNYYGFY